MTRVSRIQTALNAGELSPLLYGRPDMSKYGAGLRRSENFLPLVQGPIRRRGGLRYVGRTKNDGKSVLLPFVRSRHTAYVLEFGDLYVRFWTRRGQVVSGEDAEIYEIASPYTLEMLFNEDGTPQLTCAQSGDVLYLACPGIEPYKLSSYGPADWRLEPFRPKGGPWSEANTDKGRLITVSGSRAGTVSLSANFAAFTAGQEGMLLRLENTNFVNIPPWESFVALGYPDTPPTVRSDGKTYRFANRRHPSNDGVTGASPPTHTSGSVWDGSGSKWISGPPESVADIGVLWEYRDSGYGIVRISQVVSPTQAVAVVETGYELPDAIMGGSTWKWQMGAWSKAGTFPGAVTFFRERLVFGGGTRVWMSMAGDFENFEDKSFGQIATNNAITVTVITEQGVDSIAALASMASLVVITGGGEVVVSESSAAEPLGPENVRVYPQSAYGGLAAKPVRIGGGSVFVQSGGGKVRELSYDFASDAWAAPDLTLLSEHITRTGIVGFAYQQEPYSILWCVRADGQLIAMTHDRSQEVTAWHRHPIGNGQGKAEAVACIPSHDAARDELYVVAAVQAPGEGGEVETRRFVCCLDDGLAPGGSLEQAFFVDCGKTVESAEPIRVVPTLEHLEGLTVDILADGSTHAPQRVVDGTITLQSVARVIQVGLGYTSRLETTFIEAGAQNGTAQGAKKTIKKVVLRVHESAGGEIGSPLAERWQAVFSRDVRDSMDRPVRLVTGEVDNTPWPGGWETQGSLGIRQAQPLPLCLIAIIFVVDTVDL